VLEHNAAHILYDNLCKKSDKLCDLCLHPSLACIFFLKKSQSTDQVDWQRSTCANLLKFSYSMSESLTSSSPCLNVPICCPICIRTSPAAPAHWHYNLEYHIKTCHQGEDPACYEHLWAIGEAEKLQLKTNWNEHHKQRHMQKSQKGRQQSLVISEAHSS
ncbi:hypothetical protein CPB84DRAFT_1694712, partial [Gymnopilus junonius]